MLSNTPGSIKLDSLITNSREAFGSEVSCDVECEMRRGPHFRATQLLVIRLLNLNGDLHVADHVLIKTVYEAMNGV